MPPPVKLSTKHKTGFVARFNQFAPVRSCLCLQKLRMALATSEQNTEPDQGSFIPERFDYILCKA